MNILSLSFIIVLFVIFSVYWLISKNLKLQNFFILIVSITLYSLWNIKAVFLLLFLTLSSYLTSYFLEVVKMKYRKVILAFDILLNMGVLFTFKYYDFFVSELCELLVINKDGVLLNLILPVGISFYIFTNTGYVIDIYKNKRKAEKNIINYFSFISFFPLILSGPIERSNTLLPQFSVCRNFSYHFVVEGLQQLLWGFFKKLVIADNCASVVNYVFPNYHNLPASALIIAAFLYSFQIYFDFSGYSDIAIGMSKMLGFKVQRNFHYPYFAINIADFWRRWHMSLQRWFTDYIYFPLGGSRGTLQQTIFNTFIVFTVCGIWHGSNWTFIVWGLYNAILFIPYILFFKSKTKKNIEDNAKLISISDAIQIVITFFFVTIGWILFNSASLSDGIRYIIACFDVSILENPLGIGLSKISGVLVIMFAVIVLEWFQKDKEFALLFKSEKWLKVLVIYVILFMLVFCRAGASDFIYLQF